MALRYYANSPATKLTNACTAQATSIVVDSVTGLPISYPYTLIIDRGTASEEAVEVTAASGTTLTVTRGVDSTTALAHAASASVVHGITARDVREPNQHVNAKSGVHGVTGDVVGTTDTQTLTNKSATTPATSDDSTKVATTAFVKAALLAAHPVGDIKMTTANVNPGTYLGGTWVAWGSGRVPVGVDTGQTEFDTVEETGGVKTHTLTASEMPSHGHTASDQTANHRHPIGTTTIFIPTDAGQGTRNVFSAANTHGAVSTNVSAEDTTHSHTIGNTGGGAAHNNLQPYITCYMWKRTA